MALASKMQFHLACLDCGRAGVGDLGLSGEHAGEVRANLQSITEAYSLNWLREIQVRASKIAGGYHSDPAIPSIPVE
jgi:hypothetical protein